jgi:hypothetical protein
MEEYLIRRDQASLIAKFQTSGNDARSLLADPVVVIENPTRGSKEVLKQQRQQQSHQDETKETTPRYTIGKARSEIEIEKKG